MSDAASAPEWIRVAQDGDGPHGGFWTCAAATETSPKYIREDIVTARIEALAAEVERERFHSDRMRSQMDSFRVIATRVTKERDAAERVLAEAVEIMRPFLNVRDQFPESAKLILKKVGDLATINLTVTKGQFRAARDFITAQEKEKV
jgi:hypothetical protein